MKYGQNFEKESVPEWSLHNIDYNSLKHFIKANTTRDQAKAIAIPGQPDTHLAKVEDELYNELCAQHDSAGLFVSAKADEITRRLQHLSSQVQRLITRCKDEDPARFPRKTQRRFIRLERDVLKCGNDIQDLRRFVSAQSIAFRKILKKYRKWTGSSTLGNRFRDDVLTQPKTFTRRDFHPLQQAYDELLSIIQASAPVQSYPESPSTDDSSHSGSSDNPRQSVRRVTIHAGPPETRTFNYPSRQAGYWNEYENGSENGDAGEEYVLYINPDEETDYSADLKALISAITAPFSKARSWVKVRGQERQSLLGRPSSAAGYGAADDMNPTARDGYFASKAARRLQSHGNDPHTAIATDAEDAEDAEDADLEADIDYASSEEFPAGYETHWATLPSVTDQRMTVYKDHVMFMVTSGLYAMSFLLLGISTVLILTGRHKLRVEVDAGVTIGSVVSLGCACTALALTMARWDSLSVSSKAVISVTFATICVLTGMLLILVMGNSAL
ncbi:SPX domain-containing protein [Diaporthe helianthi]|uniref:SPX domain-containing protein n=1 Tax=Diaporthe helianthi TaxID=158607 RepID=A0A2P5HQY7_DIAHE|nr:SPX domain-containing protein [Diaporthe helianthi]